MEGWIKLYRQILDHPMWSSEPFTKGQAWIDLLLIANRSGEISTTVTELARRWRWTRQKVYRYLARLTSEKMIADTNRTETVHQADTDRTLQIYIIKWKDFQGEKGSADTYRTRPVREPYTNRTDDTKTSILYYNKNKEEGENKNAHARESAPKKRDFLAEILAEEEAKQNEQSGNDKTDSDS